jgi:hypothetical protein
MTPQTRLFTYRGTDPSYKQFDQQRVTIVGQTDERAEGLVDDEEDTVNTLYKVCSADGKEFLAYPSELT